MIGIDADGRFGNLAGTNRARVEGIHVSGSKEEAHLHSLSLAAIVIAHIESARIAEHKAELDVGPKMPQLRRRVVAVIANVIGECRPEAR
jgi:hypothetical protein